VEQALVGSYGVITTNWDNCAWNDSRIKNLAYLHGRQGYDDSILFPSEFTSDTYFSKALLEYCESEPALRFVFDFMKKENSAVREERARSHSFAINWILSATKFIFWGIGLHTYDSEILSIVAMANAESANRAIDVVCINPDGTACGTAAALVGMGVYRGSID
jgi:hypothetical protein